MVYIRNKKVKGFDYAYLVQSEWNENTNTSRQKIIKYLGRTSKVTLRDIPAEYRNNSKILAFLSSPSLTQNKRNAKAAERLRDDVLGFLCHANIEGLIGIYEKYSKSSKLTEFYDNIQASDV